MAYITNGSLIIHWALNTTAIRRYLITSSIVIILAVIWIHVHIFLRAGNVVCTTKGCTDLETQVKSLQIREYNIRQEISQLQQQLDCVSTGNCTEMMIDTITKACSHHKIHISGLQRQNTTVHETKKITLQCTLQGARTSVLACTRDITSAAHSVLSLTYDIAAEDATVVFAIDV